MFLLLVIYGLNTYGGSKRDLNGGEIKVVIMLIAGLELVSFQSGCPVGNTLVALGDLLSM